MNSDEAKPGEGKRHSHDLNVICPYCDYSYQAESEDFSDQEREQICGQCDREFLLWDEMSITHHTRPKP